MSLKEFVKIAVGLREHPKVIEAGDEAGWMFVCAIMWSKEHDTDGFIPENVVARLTGFKRPQAIVKRCVSAGLLEEFPGGYRIHDYLDHQESAAKRSEAGRKGAEARWAKNRDESSTSGCDSHADRIDIASQSHANRNANAMANANAEEEEEKEKNPQTPEGASSSSPVDKARANGFDEWLTDHAAVTGDTPPKTSTKAYRHLAEMFNGRTDDGHSLADLKLATRGAWSNDFRRQNGHVGAESVLRPTKTLKLINDGRRLAASSDGKSEMQRYREYQAKKAVQRERENGAA